MNWGSVLNDFWSHISEFLTRLRVVIIALFIATAVVSMVPISAQALNESYSNAMYETIATATINRFVHDLLPSDVLLLPMDIVSPFVTYLQISLFLGFVLSSPVIMYELYMFINPALFENERKYIALIVAGFTCLFVAGVALGYFVITPITFRVLIDSYKIIGLAPMYEFTSFLDLAVGILFASGLAFTFPVFFLILVKVGLLKTDMLSSHRRIIYVVTFVLTAVITPDPSPISDVILFVPVVVLMEVSFFLGRRIEGGRLKQGIKSSPSSRHGTGTDPGGGLTLKRSDRRKGEA